MNVSQYFSYFWYYKFHFENVIKFSPIAYFSNTGLSAYSELGYRYQLVNQEYWENRVYIRNRKTRAIQLVHRTEVMICDIYSGKQVLTILNDAETPYIIVLQQNQEIFLNKGNISFHVMLKLIYKVITLLNFNTMLFEILITVLTTVSALTKDHDGVCAVKK